MISIHQRNDRVLIYQIQDETGAPLNLAGGDVVFTMSSIFGENILVKRVGEGVDVISANDGDIEVRLTHKDTDLPAKTYRYEVAVIDVDGHRYTADTGYLTVLLSITNEGVDEIG